MGQRLIDADKMALAESAVYMAAQEIITDPSIQSANTMAHKRVQMLLDDAPTVDAVPIVRCRECKYNIGHGEADYCIRMDIFFRCHPEFFCGYGKRRCNNA